MSANRLVAGGGAGRGNWDRYTGPGDVTGSGTTGIIPYWSDGPNSVLADTNSSWDSGTGYISIPYLCGNTTTQDTAINFGGPVTLDTVGEADNGFRVKIDGNLLWELYARGTLHDFAFLNGIAGNTPLFLKASGEVGINTQTPIANKNLTIEGNSGSAASLAIVGQGAASSGNIDFYHGPTQKYNLNVQHYAVGYSSFNIINIISGNTNFQIDVNENTILAPNAGQLVYIPQATDLSVAATRFAVFKNPDMSIYWRTAAEVLSDIGAASGSISGTIGTIAKFTAGNVVGDSVITESGGVITIGGDVIPGTIKKANDTGYNTMTGGSAAFTNGGTIRDYGISAGGGYNGTIWLYAGTSNGASGAYDGCIFFQTNGGSGGSWIMNRSGYFGNGTPSNALDIIGSIEVSASLIFSNSTANCYINSPANNQIAFYTKRVGIGDFRDWSSSNPDYPLHIFSSNEDSIIKLQCETASKNAGIKTEVKTSTREFYVEQYDNQDYLKIYEGTGAVTVATFNYDGKVGINTTTFTDALTVNGGICMLQSFNLYPSNGTNTLILSGGGSAANLNGAILRIYHDTDGTYPGGMTLAPGSGSTIYFEWDNVGKFKCINNMEITSSSQYTGFNLANGSNTVAILKGFGASNDNGTLELSNGGTVNVHLWASGVSYIKGGNVCIGGTSASYLLTMEASGGGYYSSSDHQWHNGSTLEIKRDIVAYSVSDIWAKLAALNIVNYRYKSEVTEMGEIDAPYHIGFIADTTDSLFSGISHDSMAMGDCIGFLLATVKELKKEIDILKGV